MYMMGGIKSRVVLGALCRRSEHGPLVEHNRLSFSKQAECGPYLVFKPSSHCRVRVLLERATGYRTQIIRLPCRRSLRDSSDSLPNAYDFLFQLGLHIGTRTGMN